MRYKGLKGKAWEAVRLYIRTNEKDCFTCGSKNLQGQNFQCGHYIPVALSGSNNTLSWDEKQIHAQCGRCNGAGQGQQVAYRAHLVTIYGEAMVKELEARRWKVDPIKNWQEIIDRYETLLLQLPRKEPAISFETLDDVISKR